MRHFLFPTILVLTTLTAFAAETRPADTRPAHPPYSAHNGYFVSNKFEPNAPASFVVLRDQKSFDEVFGAAMVMGDKSERLPMNAFDTRIVISAIKRGKAVWTFTVKEVANDHGALTIRYTTTETKQETAEFSCPLIISMPKGDYTSVEFIEDGKSVKKLDLKSAASQPASQPALSPPTTTRSAP